MKKELLILTAGLAAGMYIGYTREDELDDVCRKTKKCRRKMMKKMHHMEDGLCDYLDIH